jgi:hypothetical protein
MSADAFGAFEEVNLDDRDEVSKVGKNLEIQYWQEEEVNIQQRYLVILEEETQIQMRY